MPVTSCGEENLVSIGTDPHYSAESILVHEFGHTVMEVGLSPSERAAIVRAHGAALDRQLYTAASYIGSCPEEYWAEATP